MYGEYNFRPSRASERQPIGVIGNFNFDNDKPVQKVCAYCSIIMHCDRKYDVYWCLRCGYNRPKEYDDDDKEKMMLITV
jgi:hypothetical protein